MLKKCQKTTCFTDKKTRLATTPSPSPPSVCPLNTSPCVRSNASLCMYRHHAHTCFNMCARGAGTNGDVLNVDTRRRVECVTHGVSTACHHTAHTPHHNTQHNTTQHNSTQHSTAQHTTRHDTTRHDHNNTTTETWTRDRDRQRQTETEKEDRDRERRRRQKEKTRDKTGERREKIHF